MTRPTGPQDSPGFLLWRSTLRWQRTVAAALRPLDLTHVQFVLLAAAWWLGAHRAASEPLPSQRQLAAHADTDVMMTSQVVRVLERRGLVERTADDAGDGRVKRLAVTDAGRDLAVRAVEVVEAADEAFFARVPDHGRLLAVLGQLADLRVAPPDVGQEGALTGTAATSRSSGTRVARAVRDGPSSTARPGS